jgi:hypothetical protein
VQCLMLAVSYIAVSDSAYPDDAQCLMLAVPYICSV